MVKVEHMASVAFSVILFLNTIKYINLVKPVGAVYSLVLLAKQETEEWNGTSWNGEGFFT